MTEDGNLRLEPEELLSVKRKWIAFLRLAVIVFTVMFLWKTLYPYDKEFFTIRDKYDETMGFAMQPDGNYVFIVPQLMKGRYKVGDTLIVYYDKKSGKAVKMRKGTAWNSW